MHTDPVELVDRLVAAGVSLARGKSGAVLRLDAREAPSAVDDQIVQQLASLERLRELYLANSRISDTAVESILALQHLTVLDVQNTSLSEPAILRLSQLPNLKLFIIRGTGASADSIAELRKRLIQTRIVG